ncbi:MAG: MCE family protein [Nostocoides sp.]
MIDRLTSLPRWRMPVTRRAAPLAVACAAAVVLSGCNGIADLPLPGGKANGGQVFRVTAEFADVLDLVPQASVKINEVSVGSVEKITLTGWTAKVTIRLPDGTALPHNATAELKQTSLLGEKYIELSPPTGIAPVGRLRDGDDIPLSRTNRNPEVEEVLSAMSLLLNGGGVAQLKVIETELNAATHGNEKSIKDLISQLDTFVGGLDKQKAEIVRAIDNLDKLAAKLAAQKDTIAASLQQFPKGLTILADQRKQLTGMLQALSRLGAVGTKVIIGSRTDLEANLKDLGPILTNLSKAGDALPQSLQLLLTYPFPDSAVGAIKGDYTNLHITADLDLNNLTKILPQAGSAPGLPTLPGAPSLPGTSSLPSPPGASSLTTLLGGGSQ